MHYNSSLKWNNQKMLIILYLVLMLRVGRCTDYRIFERKTDDVGNELKLTCPHETSATSFWIRLVSGNPPEVLGRTFNTESADPRITVSGEAGTFVLRIKNITQSDTGIYYCMKIQPKVILWAVDLRVEGPESDITAVPPPDPVRPTDSATLQCSVLSDCENKTCPGDLSMCCLRVGSNESHPSFDYNEQNSAKEYENNPEGLSTKKCILNNVSSSDAGTYYCAVATCEEIFCRNRSKPHPEAVNVWDSQRANTILLLLCAVLAITLIGGGFLLFSIKACDCCNGTLNTVGPQNQHLRTDEDTRVYSAVVFTVMKTGSGGRGTEKQQRERGSTLRAT